MIMARRANTTLIARTNRRSTVRQFIQHLHTTAAIPKPVGNLLLASHANSEGKMVITLFTGAPGETDYATIENSMADPANSIAIPDSLIGYTGGPPTTFVHFKGCNIGKNRNFLVRFKEALGDHINMTAPKHFHDVHFDTRFGVWESMAYEFTIRQPKPFADRPAALAAFAGRNFPLISGTVPAAHWDTPLAGGTKWIPARIDRGSSWKVRAKLATPVGSKTTAETIHEWRVDTNLGFRVVIASTATDDAARKQDLQSDLGGRARFKSGHAFPMYEELGYSSLSDFMSGYDWRFRPLSGGDLECNGSRVVYTSVIPILDPADALDGTLIANFYPNTGSAHPAILTSLVESDPIFFESV
jgi:hypothetical protein